MTGGGAEGPGAWTSMPSAPGTYVLWLRREGSGPRIRVGSLGEMALRPGWYAYVGSALGPGGLGARIRHHLARSSRPHWHVDYLRPHCRPCRAWIAGGGERREHHWAARLGTHGDSEVPLRGFGASDCRCGAHLFRFPGELPGSALRRELAGSGGEGDRGTPREVRLPPQS